MSYNVRIRGGKVYYLDDKTAESLKETLASTTKPFMVELENDMVRSIQITEITKEQVTEVDVRKVFGDHIQIEGGKRCVGRYSIQAEANNIIRDTYPKSWAKKIRSDEVREGIRLRLRKTDAIWCDYKEGECSCP